MEDVIEKFSKRTGLKLRPGETEEDAPAPRNTAAQDPLFLLMSLMGGASEGIERMERDGQRYLNATSTIPTAYNGYDPKVAKALLCRAGFEIGKVVEGDELFRYCRLPEGWSKKATDHSLWTTLVDEKGRVRGSIFYKAAFYDRRAHMSLERRLMIQNDYEARDQGVFRYQVVAKMPGEEKFHVLHTVEKSGFPVRDAAYNLPEAERRAYFNAMDDARAEAVTWLEENFPDHQDELAYWDETFA